MEYPMATTFCDEQIEASAAMLKVGATVAPFAGVDTFTPAIAGTVTAANNDEATESFLIKFIKIHPGS